MGKNIFDMVGKLRPKRNLFDLSHRVNTTCDFGELIPVMMLDVVAGDHFTFGAETLVRLQPMEAPIMHELTAYLHYYNVPYRLLDPDWTKFIAQGNVDTDTPLEYELKRVGDANNFLDDILPHMFTGSNWDYFGFRIFKPQVLQPTGRALAPLIFPWQAYSLIFNEYYRDQDLQPEIDIQSGVGGTGSSTTPEEGMVNMPISPLYRNWRKDYFTAARPFRQKGVAPSLPINISEITVPESYPHFDGSYFYPNGDVSWQIQLGLPVGQGVPANDPQGMQNWPTYFMGNNGGAALPTPPLPNGSPTSMMARMYTPEQVINAEDVTVTSFDISDLRLAVQLQKWLERNARAGTRYTEFLEAHFGVSPRDERLQRPEYIGGTKTPVVISEILQTSNGDNTATNSVGRMAGHGLAANASYAGKYHVQEPGIIMALLSIMPKPSYSQGINRAWMRENPTDYYFEEFSHLSEQQIMQSELFYTAGQQGTDDFTPFGYTGQYDELRVMHDMTTGEMRRAPSDEGSVNPPSISQLNYWNMTRQFSEAPLLNDNFIACVPDYRQFTVIDGIHHAIVNIHHAIRAARPMPLIAEPGLMDHF